MIGIDMEMPKNAETCILRHSILDYCILDKNRTTIKTDKNDKCLNCPLIDLGRDNMTWEELREKVKKLSNLEINDNNVALKNYELKLKGKWDFERKPRFGNGIQYIFEFRNGYGASVIKNKYSYGSESDLWELGVLKNGHLSYDNSVANGDVRGYLTDEKVEELLTEIKSFKNVPDN